MKKGKLIVIEGHDGSGKTTQLKLLAKYLRKKGHTVKILDFPRYGRKSAALVEEYLRGAYGGVDEVSAKATSIFYAIDRFAASKEFSKWLDEGVIILSNRYTTSNEAHQGAKLRTRKERENFWKWNEELEYEIFGIPKPDRVYRLHVPVNISKTLIKKRNRRRKKISKDIHEENVKYLRKTEKVYNELSKRSPIWKTIQCTANNTILSKEEIHERIIGDITSVLKNNKRKK